MKRDGTIWDQKDGCAKQYIFSIAYYLTSFLSKSHQIVLDRSVDKPVYGKYVVDGFNAVQKRYLATCLRMHSIPEVNNIDSKRMYVDTMTEKEILRFSEECKRLLDLCDKICTKGDNKHAKYEAKAR